MKNLVNCFQIVKNLILKNSAVILCFLFLAFLVTQSYALAEQTPGVKELDAEITKIAATVKNIISTIIMIILALGGAYIIYEFATGSEKARKHLLLFCAALVIFGILKALKVL